MGRGNAGGTCIVTPTNSATIAPRVAPSGTIASGTGSDGPSESSVFV
jgi:hypothetical protein